MTTKPLPESPTWTLQEAKAFFRIKSDNGMKAYKVAPMAFKTPSGWRWNKAACEAFDAAGRPPGFTMPAPVDSKGPESTPGPDDEENIVDLILRMQGDDMIGSGLGWDTYTDRDWQPENMSPERKRIIDHLTAIHVRKMRAKYE
jgi:hypothetical protein